METRMKFRAFACGLAMVFGSLAIHESAAERPAGKADDPNRVTCETTHQVGSRLGGVRRCHTQAEWAQIRAETRDVMHRIQAEGATNCVPTAERPGIC
jgi:cytochrome c5